MVMRCTCSPSVTQNWGFVEAFRLVAGAMAGVCEGWSLTDVKVAVDLAKLRAAEVLEALEAREIEIWRSDEEALPMLDNIPKSRRKEGRGE